MDAHDAVATPAAPPAEVLSYCRICAAACGIVVTVDRQRVVRVRGDADHPASRGYVCAKGRGLAEWHHRPDRLDRPRLDGVDATWSEVLDDLAGRLRSVIDETGPDAVAMYLATGLAYDAAGQVAAGTWMSSIGSGSFYTAATVDNAPVLVAAEMVTGSAMLSPVWDPTSQGVLVLVGTNPVVSHGYGTTLPDPVRHLRDFRRDGGRIWVIDPRRSESAALADEHLAVRPGADVEVLAALAAALLDEGAVDSELTDHCDAADVEALRAALAPFTVGRAARAADVDEEAIARLVADVRAHPGRLAVLCGTGTTMGTDGIVVEWLRWVLLILTGSLDRPGGMRFQDGPLGRLRPPTRDRAHRAPAGPASRPELPRVIGQVPAVALVDEIEAGRVRALLITGGNPIAALPEPDRVRAALAGLDLLVTMDVVDGEICDLASHVLPATGQLERSDITLTTPLSVRAAVQSTAPVVDAVAERRPVWWMFDEIASRLDGSSSVAAPTRAMAEDSYLRGMLARSPLGADAVLAAGPHGLDMAVDVGWVHDSMLADGRWQIAPEVMLDRLRARGRPTAGLVLTPRREMAWSNSVRYAGAGEESLVRMHPDDAAASRVMGGDTVIVTSRYGSMTAVVAIDANVRPGVVSVTHGRTGSLPGQVTSAHAEIDPITTMPHASGLAVTVVPAVTPGHSTG